MASFSCVGPKYYHTPPSRAFEAPSERNMTIDVVIEQKHSFVVSMAGDSAWRVFFASSANKGRAETSATHLQTYVNKPSLSLDIFRLSGYTFCKQISPLPSTKQVLKSQNLSNLTFHSHTNYAKHISIDIPAKWHAVQADHSQSRQLPSQARKWSQASRW